MANHLTGAQRHNNRQDKIWEACKRIEEQKKKTGCACSEGVTCFYHQEERRKYIEIYGTEPPTI